MFRSIATGVVIISLYAMSLMVWPARAQADVYQEQISHAFPGFEILNRSDFTEEVQQIVKTNPALATGHFNQDKVEDFAAIILNRSTQYAQQAEKKYYLGKYVVCQGAGKGRYQCETLKDEHMYLPYPMYLRRVKPGKLECVVGKDQKVEKIALRQDGVGWVFIDRGSAVYIYRSDGSYWECARPSD